jgi:hypothetical protein
VNSEEAPENSEKGLPLAAPADSVKGRENSAKALLAPAVSGKARGRKAAFAATAMILPGENLAAPTSAKMSFVTTDSMPASPSGKIGQKT